MRYNKDMDQKNYYEKRNLHNLEKIEYLKPMLKKEYNYIKKQKEHLL